jgi:hypothetical protein
MAFSISKEHNMALDILHWITINDYNINDLIFELLNREDRKNGYTYVINKPIDIKVIENLISKSFIDKSSDVKQYLSVYKL